MAVWGSTPSVLSLETTAHSACLRPPPVAGPCNGIGLVSHQAKATVRNKRSQGFPSWISSAFTLEEGLTWGSPGKFVLHFPGLYVSSIYLWAVTHIPNCPSPSQRWHPKSFQDVAKFFNSHLKKRNWRKPCSLHRFTWGRQLITLLPIRSYHWQWPSPRITSKRQRCPGGYSPKPSCDRELGGWTGEAPAGTRMPQGGSQHKNKKAGHTLLLASEVLASILLPVSTGTLRSINAFHMGSQQGQHNNSHRVDTHRGWMSCLGLHSS